MIYNEMEEAEVNITAKNISEIALVTLNLLSSIEEDSEYNRNGNKDSKTEVLSQHFETYFHKSPLPSISFKDISLEWFNVTESLTVEEHLTSHIVILDFFTYCCINCLHVLPDLEALEEKYPVNDSPVVVIGVHSAKFSNEKITNNVADAIKRYHIMHPVANDVGCKLWDALGISCWPTLLILGPGGVPLFVLMGEGNREELFTIVDESVKYFTELQKLNPRYLPVAPSVHLPLKETSSLNYPGKIESYPEGLIIADSGSHRIVISDYDGVVKAVIGCCGIRGFKDGSFEESLFSNPQGISYHPAGLIFVADTDNHAIRKIDLQRGTVETIAGTGQQGTDRLGGLFETKQAISSPWDLCLAHTTDLRNSEASPNLLLIAMAGSHQIWGMFLTDSRWLKNSFYAKGTVICLAGSGIEENRNTSYPLKAGFAQPSGICLCKSRAEQTAFIADSESSAVRQFSLADGSVRRVLGGGIDPRDLFTFGDEDGFGNAACFQHPLGVCCSGEAVYVADTYNHKLKIITKQDKKYGVQTLFGGEMEAPMDQAKNENNSLNEPGGLCYSLKRNSIFIADTNNSCIKEFSLEEKTVRKVTLNFACLTTNSDKSEDAVDWTPGDIFTVFIPDVNMNIILKIHIALPADCHLTPEMKQKFEITTFSGNITCLETEGFFNCNEVEIPLEILPSSSDEGETFFIIRFLLYLCTDSGICLTEDISRKIMFLKGGQDNKLPTREVEVTIQPKMEKHINTSYVLKS